MTPEKFRSLVWKHYRMHGRHDLPWRKTSDVYKVIVSEVMLQQTQVDRVMPFYKKFIKQFPTASKLAKAPLSDVLKAWQGLGYNRRAKLLREAAQQLVRTPRFGTRSNLVTDVLVARLEELPGVGPYTARAVAAFAFNEDVIVIETNIRTAVIYHFFPGKEKVADTEIEKILIEVLPKAEAREWYSALMDYGAHLKRSGISHNARSATYTKQSRFAGSLREARGAILRELANGSRSRGQIAELLGSARSEQTLRALGALCADGLVQVKADRYSLPR